MENKHFTQEIEKVEKELSDAMAKIALSEVKIEEDEISRYLSMSKEELLKQTAPELNYISYKITNYSLFIQQQINHIEAIKIWIYAQLKKVVAKDILNYKGVSWAYAEQLAINNNDWATILNEKLTKINMCLAQYHDIVNIITNYSKKIDNIAYSNRKEII